jgi:nitrogen fixation/metabolism regulation signal transduction histidine kinase
MPADGRMTVNGRQILYSTAPSGGQLYVLYRLVPEQVASDVNYFSWAAERYAGVRVGRPYLRSMVGVVLFVISFVIAGLAVVLSLVLSKNITRPVLELNEAARAVAGGNFTIRVHRDSSDELSLLYRSFNAMVQQLDESRKAVFHIQKLEAWREVGRKLLHEIKNPLTPIKLSAERMRRRYLEHHPDIERIILSGTETIIEEVNALEHIMGEFTRFARLPEAVLAPHELNRTLENCAHLFSSHEHVQIVLALDEKIGLVRYDKVLLRQAVINLLKNAVEAFDGAAGIIEVMSRLKDEHTVMVSVRDNGPGIAPEDLEQLFEPTFSRKATGSGLGLAIVEKIVIAHKGRISC